MATTSHSTHPVLCYYVGLQSDDLIEEMEIATLLLAVTDLYPFVTRYSQQWTQITIIDKSGEYVYFFYCVIYSAYQSISLLLFGSISYFIFLSCGQS